MGWMLGCAFNFVGFLNWFFKSLRPQLTFLVGKKSVTNKWWREESGHHKYTAAWPRTGSLPNFWRKKTFQKRSIDGYISFIYPSKKDKSSANLVPFTKGWANYASAYIHISWFESLKPDQIITIQTINFWPILFGKPCCYPAGLPPHDGGELFGVTYGIARGSLVPHPTGGFAGDTCCPLVAS